MSRIYFFWDPLSDNILQERDESGTVTAEYTTEPGLYGNLISQNRGGIESQYHFDPQGSTLALTNDNQNVTDSFAYTAFGEVTELTGGTTNPFQYVGQKQYCSVGSHLCGIRRRHCDGMTGRFLSADAFITIAHSRYVYCRNNSTSHIDPSGLRCKVVSSANNVRGTPWSDFDDLAAGGDHPFFYAAKQFWYVQRQKKYSDYPNEWDLPWTTGPGLAFNSKTASMPEKSWVIAYWARLVYFIVCEDNAGDCELAIYESWKEEYYETDTWIDKTDKAKKKRFPAIPRRTPKAGIGDAQIIVPAAADWCCDKKKSKIIISIDIPNLDACLKPVRFRGVDNTPMGRRLTVNQEVIVYEKGNEAPVASFDSTFTIGVGKSGTLIADP